LSQPHHESKNGSHLGGICPLNSPGGKGGALSNTGCMREQKTVHQYLFLGLLGVLASLERCLCWQEARRSLQVSKIGHGFASSNHFTPIYLLPSAFLT